MCFLQGIPADSLIPFRTLLSDSPNLFAGSAFLAFGLAAAVLAIVRRKFDALLIYFALCASLYGLRMLIKSPIVGVPMAYSAPFARFRAVLDFLMPIPAFLFFSATGLLHRNGRYVGYLLAVIGTLLAIISCFYGAFGVYYTINNSVVIFAVLILIWDFLAKGTSGNKEYIVMRRGFLTFSGFALFDNIAGIAGRAWPRVEPIGFAVLLACLGYVTTFRIFKRDQQLANIQKELEVATQIQLSILPEAFPANPNFRVEARYAPMTSVAGDFYDYTLSENEQASLLVADVSGHGIPAALIASMVKLAAASQRASADEPAKFLAGMNAALCGNTQGQFVTAAYVCLNAAEGELRYSAAGHPPMMILRNRTVSEIEENGLMLAAFEFATYAEVRLELRNGDRLLLYTDGLIEAANSEGNFLGRERLADLLAETAALDAVQAADRILSSVRSWAVAQEDDLTLIICDFCRATS